MKFEYEKLKPDLFLLDTIVVFSMASLTFLFTVLSSLPMLVVFLAGILFLQRTRIFQSIHDGLVLDTNTKKSTIKNPNPESVLSSDTSNVSKESDFPQTWFTGTSTWDLEKRAIFSKVSHPTHP